ncbi:MAG TPA: O-antigen ligase family protein, partial [Candidatus Aminicenantes bacterium]|nr:O-antigen ligase family protein [Candidatus Aminicenantes bacterium]
CLMWMLLKGAKVPSFSNPVGFFFYYCAVGLAVSFFSPEKLTALYWGGAYLAPVLVVWIVLSGEDILERMRKVLFVNYAASFLIFMLLLPDIYGYGFRGKMRFMFYELPFGLGEMRANGVARFALVLFIISGVRLLSQKNVWRYLWAVPLILSTYTLMQTQSRTALLGLVVAGVLMVYIMGLRWQFLFLGPAAAYVLWRAGFQERGHGSLERLVNLTGRQLTWQQAVVEIKKSPFLGWGFHADRILLDSQHMHNSYLHAMLHGGIVGLVFFAAAVFSIWYVILKENVLKRIKKADEVNRPFLIESVLIIGFLSSRSLFESTAAFFGVDLLLFIPAAAYIYVWAKRQ